MSSFMVEDRMALAKSVELTDETLSVELADGRTIAVPLEWFPRLSHATVAERNTWRLIAGGRGVHWPRIDEDISMANVLAGQPSAESQASFKKWLAGRAKPSPKKKSISEVARLLEKTLETFDPTWGQAEKDRFESMTTLSESIKKAAESKDEDGNPYSHQRKQWNFAEWRESLKKAMKVLPDAEKQFRACESFEEIHSLVWQLVAGFKGLKRMYCYDVAFRIGANLKLLPEDKVYLHANPLKAAEMIVGREATKKGYLDMSELPELLQEYPAWQVEDILCEFNKVAEY